MHVFAINKLERQLQRKLNADFEDIDQVKCKAMSQDDERAVKDMTLTDQMVTGKHKLAIPWKIDPSTSLINRCCAATRL